MMMVAVAVVGVRCGTWMVWVFVSCGFWVLRFLFGLISGWLRVCFSGLFVCSSLGVALVWAGVLGG